MNSVQIQSKIDANLDELSKIMSMNEAEACEAYNVECKKWLFDDIFNEIKQLRDDWGQALVNEEFDKWYASELDDQWHDTKKEYELFNN